MNVATAASRSPQLLSTGCLQGDEYSIGRDQRLSIPAIAPILPRDHAPIVLGPFAGIHLQMEPATDFAKNLSTKFDAVLRACERCKSVSEIFGIRHPPRLNLRNAETHAFDPACEPKGKKDAGDGVLNRAPDRSTRVRLDGQDSGQGNCVNSPTSRATSHGGPKVP